MSYRGEVPHSNVIRIVAAVILNSAGSLLLVRKRETTAFMQPGGKPEAGETSADALARELREEVGFELDAVDCEFVGRYEAQAANEPGHLVDADVFFVVAMHEGAAAAEIEELVWVDPWKMDHLELAPLTAEVLRPFILTRAAALRGMADPWSGARRRGAGFQRQAAGGDSAPGCHIHPPERTETCDVPPERRHSATTSLAPPRHPRGVGGRNSRSAGAASPAT